MKYTPNNLSFEDLYNIAKWGLTNDYNTSGCWDLNDDLEGAINCAIDDFKEFLNIPYPIQLGNIPSKPIIYRLIKLYDINHLDKIKIGISWFSNSNQPKDHPEFFQMLDYLRPKFNPTDEDGRIFIIKGITDKDNIDIARTLWERSTQFWENEIVIIDESKIQVLDVQEFRR
jgi:hypothetical protein